MGRRRKFKKNSAIRALFQRARFLAASGFPQSLKLAFMGFTKAGGAPLRTEKLRRKLPRQLRGVGNKEHIRPLID